MTMRSIACAASLLLTGCAIIPAAPPETAAQSWRVPVCYGGEFGIDLAELAARHGMTESAVVASGIEQLTDPATARSWLLAHDLLDPDAAITAADLRRLLAVREGLRALWRGDGPAPLNRALAD